jgi:hypothetical protein
MESKKINQLATEMSPVSSDLTIIGDPITGVSKKVTLLQIADIFQTTGTVSSVAVTETGNALTITGSPITSAGTINIGFAGDATQYVRGDGALADFPTSTGGGSSVSYYLNSSVSQGTIGGVAYRELSKDPISGAGTDITISANGYVASYITDANYPALLEVPGGNFNCEFYFSVNSNNHNPYVYAELYKYDGTTFTLLGSSQSVPEYLTNGTTLSPYYFAIPVATAALTITDRLAIRIYVNVDGRTVTLHTENNHLCQVVTTFSKGLTSLNNLTRQVQFLATGTSGTDFNISSSTATHTFNLPIASATNTGKLSSTDWSTFNGKQPAGNYVTLDTTQTITAAKTFSSNIISDGSILLKNGIQSLLSGYVNIGGNAFGKGIDITFPDSGGSPLTNTLNFNPTTAYSYIFPAANGTIALTSDLNAYVTLATTQTISGAKTFSLDILVNGLTIGRGGSAVVGNTAIGLNSLLTNTTGVNNSALGNNSLRLNTTGGNNTAIGVNALQNNTTASFNTAIGNNSLNANTTGANNTTIGSESLTALTTGSNNTAIGYTSGSSITTGSNNTIVGNYIGTTAMSNNIVLADGAGNIRYQWNGTNNVFGNPISGTSATFSGDLSIVNSTSAILNIQGNSGNSKNIFFKSTGAADNSIRLYQDGGTNNFIIATGDGTVAPTNRLTIASTGAATFSSSVTATSFSVSNGSLSNNGFWGTLITAGTGSGFDFGLVRSNADGIMGVITGTSNVRFFGNVGINVTNPVTAKLNIAVANSGSNQGGIDITNGANASFNVSLRTDITEITAGGTGNMVFSNTAERLRITSGGVLQFPDVLGLKIGFNGGAANYYGIEKQAAVAGGDGLFKFESGKTSAGEFGFSTGGTNRMVITAGGFIKASNTGSVTYLVNSSNEFQSNVSDAHTLGVVNSSASPYGQQIIFNGASPNNTTNFFFFASDSTNSKFIVWSNGNVVNRNNSYGSISDFKLKENIEDATPKLNDLLKVKIRNYNLIGDDKKQIGVIAQELEEVFPSMIDESEDFEEIEVIDEEGNITKERQSLGTSTKSVKYSVFVPMLIKAIQELEARIKQLENK